MKQLIIAACSALALVSGAEASPWQLETAPTAYLSIPLDGRTHTDSLTTYGLALGQIQAPTLQQPESSLFDSGRPPLVELQFKGDAISALNVNGVNTLTTTNAYQADDDDDSDTGIKKWGVLAAGVLALGGVVWLGDNQSNDHNGPDRATFRQVAAAALIKRRVSAWWDARPPRICPPGTTFIPRYGCL